MIVVMKNTLFALPTHSENINKTKINVPSVDCTFYIKRQLSNNSMGSILRSTTLFCNDVFDWQ